MILPKVSISQLSTSQYSTVSVALLLVVGVLVLLSRPLAATSNGHVTLSEQLPLLGDRISAISSPEQEYQLGRAWLRSLRRQANLINDPLLTDYVENVVYRLASFSNIDSPQLEIVIINNKAINAFAVPGGIIGLNAGLFLHADTEDELASVLAHELAHLSQRHFARNSEYAKRNQITQLATLLASVAIMATGSGESGIATLATSLALSQQSQLRYSRDNEREADSIGMQTLARAGVNPLAMPKFFEKMSSHMRFAGEAPPEFLLTHPVTQSRIADSRLRAAQYNSTRFKAVNAPDQLEFELMRARVLAAYSRDSQKGIDRFRAESAAAGQPNSNNGLKTQLSQTAKQYGLVRALLKANQFKAAEKALLPLRTNHPNRITYIATEAEILMAREQYDQAATFLKQHLALNPNNYPLSVYYAQSLLRTQQPKLAIRLLEQLIQTKSENLYLWRLLSEAHGENGHIVGVHRARAEVFFLRNQTTLAIEQLKYALELSKNHFQLNAKIKHRIHEIEAYKEKWRIR